MEDWIKPGSRVRCRVEFETPNPYIPTRPFIVRANRVVEILEVQPDNVRLGPFSFGGFETNGHIDCDLKELLRYWEPCDEAPPKTAEPKPMILPPEKEGGPKRIGYWASSHILEKDRYAGKLPWPGDFINNAWNRTERAMVVAYLKDKYPVEVFFGASPCRICEEENGHSDLTDKFFVWPEGFAHYIEAHGVVPDQEFIDHVKQQIKERA